MMMSAPVMIVCQNELTLSRLAPLLIVCNMRAPMTGPWTEPTAPKRLAPPMTYEAIDCSSSPWPWVGLPMPIRVASSTPTKAANSEHRT